MEKKFTHIAIFLTYIEPNATFPLGGIPFKKYTTCEYTLIYIIVYTPNLQVASP